MTAVSPMPALWLEGDDYFLSQDEPLLGPHLVKDTSDPVSVPLQSLPWHKRPSPIWLVPGMLLMAACLGACVAPRLEIYSLLVCRSQANPHYIHLSLDTLPDAAGSPIMINPWVPNWLASGRLDPDACRHDGHVQKRVAALNTGMVLCMGILSAFTTGFYGSLSDRKGRTRILALSLLGLAANDVIFLTTVHFVDKLSYKFFLVGPLIEGILGGMATASAATNGYIADCTEAGSRARIYSFMTGAMFLGFGIGPTMGALIVRTTNNVIAPFYLTVACYLVVSFFVAVVVPEALSDERQAESRIEYERTVKDAVDAARDHKLLMRLRTNAFQFLKPLTLFMPRKEADASPEGVHILRSTLRLTNGKRDWSLTLVAASYGIYAGLFAIVSVKLLYTQYKFSWGPVEIGYLLTFLGVCRVLYLLVVLPVIIRFFKRKPPTTSTNTEHSSLLQVSKDTSVEDREHAHTRSRVLHDSHFDLWLARISLLIDTAVYIALVLQTSPSQFIAISALQSFAGGANPAMQSLALALVSPKDSGKLFAALAVLQTLMAQILGPFVYGTLYATTVDIFPETVFAVGAGLFFLCFLCLSSIRLRSRRKTEPI